MAIHIGREKAGWKGLIVAGLCFILPAVFITIIFAFLYKRYGTLPEIQPFIYGIRPAIIAIILGAIFPFAKKSLKSTELIIVAILVLICSLFNFNEIYLMFGTGFLALFLFAIKNNNLSKTNDIFSVSFLQITNTISVASTSSNLFWIFLKIGSILYGGGYVLFAFLDTELVSTGLLSRQQLIDAIAVDSLHPVLFFLQ